MPGQRFGLFQQIVGRRHSIHQTQPPSFVGVYAAAGEEQVERAAGAHDARQEVGQTGIRAQTSLDENRLEPGVFATHAHVAGQRQSHAGAGSDAVDRGDGGFVQSPRDHQRLPANPVVLVNAVAPAGVLVRRAVGGQVGSGTKAPPGPGEYDHTNAVVVLNLPASFHHLQMEIAVDGVEFIRTVQGDHGDLIVTFQVQIVVGHRLSPRGLCKAVFPALGGTRAFWQARLKALPDCHVVAFLTLTRASSLLAMMMATFGGHPSRLPSQLTDGSGYFTASMSHARPSMILVPLTRLFMPTDSLVPWV